MYADIWSGSFHEKQFGRDVMATWPRSIAPGWEYPLDDALYAYTLAVKEHGKRSEEAREAAEGVRIQCETFGQWLDCIFGIIPVYYKSLC